jgi:hypothetical protein
MDLSTTRTFKNKFITPINLILLLLVLQLAVTLLSDGFVLSFDESMWHYIGRNWFRHGLVPYTGGVDNKSPFIFAVFGLSDLLFGVNYWFPRVLATLCQSVGVYYVYKITKHIAGEKAALIAIPVYGLSLMWHATGGVYVAFTETYEVMFMTMAIYRYITARNKYDLLIGGLFAGLALDFRLTAAFAILAILISMLGKKSLLQICLFCFGVLMGVLVLVIISSLAGIHLHELLVDGITDNFGVGSPTFHSLTYKTDNLLAKFVYSPVSLFYPLTCVYLFIPKKEGWLILWAILAFAAINIIGIYDDVHLKDILPPLAIMNALAAAYLVERYRVKAFHWVWLAICIIFFPGISEAVRNANILIYGQTEKPIYGKPPYINPSEGDRKLLGKWVRDHTNVNDLVLVHSFGTQIQVYSERISPSVYFSITQTALAKTRFYHDLQRHEPAMILIPMFDQYQTYVDAGLRMFVARIIVKDYYLDRTLFNYKIFRHKKA